jgi:energy-converting hydrogenase Eha subunit C
VKAFLITICILEALGTVLAKSTLERLITIALLLWGLYLLYPMVFV